MFKLSDFTQEINSGGVVKPNKYLVSFSSPIALSGASTSTLSLRCDDAQLPGLALATAEGPPRFGYGAMEANPYGVIFDDVTLSFVLDTKSSIHKYFYSWANEVVNFKSKGQSALATGTGAYGANAYEVGYKDNYVTDIKVLVYKDSSTDKSTQEQLMQYTLYRAFPKNLPPVSLSWATTNDFIKFPVSFSYTDYLVQYF